MAHLVITIEPALPVEKALRVSPQVVVRYTREIPTEEEIDSIATDVTERIFALSPDLVGQFDISDYAPSTAVELSIKTSQGVPIIVLLELEPQQVDEENAPFTLRHILDDTDVVKFRNAFTPNNPQTTRVLLRAGRFVVIGAEQPDFRNFTLLVSPISTDQLSGEVLTSLFEIEQFHTTASLLPGEEVKKLSELQLGAIYTTSINLDGQFQFALPIEGNEMGWLWLLTGSTIFIGLQEEADLSPVSKITTILLPIPMGTAVDGISPLPAGISATNGNVGRPLDATEEELLNNPGLFNDDPGLFCKPFQNPNRIIGERTFHTILRVTQPEIGGDPSVPPREKLPHFPFSPGLDNAAEIASGRESGLPSPIERLSPRVGLTSFVAALRAVATDNPLVSTSAALAQRRSFILANSRGRSTLDRTTALDWEGDSTIYQATSLAFGHILEYRVRWRSNGYSLGDVAHTLTLAPRQARRILMAESRIVDRVRREERTQLADALTQETRREYTYTDAVQSHLSEWARGGSEASSSGIAGGLGFAVGPFVIGGGASHGQSNSSSWQRGGRNVAAQEEQSLRDAIRQYGESLRKLESLVIIEQSQEEFVQAISEVVRNPNYCHSLTIIYHQILRHLRVDTEIVGARECVFVPLAIRPFTLERVIRWRDILERNLRKRELRWVMRYLEDVNENFAPGTIPEGKRYTHPIHFLSGSIYLQLAIERPQDKDDGTLDEAKWLLVAPHTDLPFRHIFSRLQEVSEAQRDIVFQRDHSPTIAASWVNSLLIDAGNGPLPGANFTLASKYEFNKTLRVDFNFTPNERLTRENLQTLTIHVPDEAKLPPSSVANVQRVEIQYYTDTFDRRETSPNQFVDLINVETGIPEPAGAHVFIKLSEWEKQDLRSIIRGAAEDLITHLNEHIEYYHKCVWWDPEFVRDKMPIMLDSVYVSGKEDGRSVASVVTNEPVAIMGNCLVYPVAGGVHLGVDGHETPADLNNYYRDTATRSEPIRISLPTSGLYAQSIIDDCEACEEHFGSTEWILSDKEPELAELGVEALTSRRAALPETAPSQFPASIINLQNAPNVPSPAGLADVLNAVQNAQAFRDFAGLAATQANARAAMETAANLANQFGAHAVELRKAEMAAKIAKEKMSTIDKAFNSHSIDEDEKNRLVKQALDEMNMSGTSHEERMEVIDLLNTAGANQAEATVEYPNGKRIRVNATGSESTASPDIIEDSKNGVIALKKIGLLPGEPSKLTRVAGGGDTDSFTLLGISPDAKGGLSPTQIFQIIEWLLGNEDHGGVPYTPLEVADKLFRVAIDHFPEGAPVSNPIPEEDLAEALRQMAAQYESSNDRRTGIAIELLFAGLKEFLVYDPRRGMPTSKRFLIHEIAKLDPRRPGSTKVKTEVATYLGPVIGAAKQYSKADAVDITDLLAKVLESDARAIILRLADNLRINNFLRIVDGNLFAIFYALLTNLGDRGVVIVGLLFVEATFGTTGRVKEDPSDLLVIRLQGQTLGYMVAETQYTLFTIEENEKAAIKSGAAILRASLKILTKLGAGTVVGLLELNTVVGALETAEVNSVQEALVAIEDAYRKTITEIVVAELPQSVQVLDANGNPVLLPDGSKQIVETQEAFLEARVKATNDMRSVRGLPTI